MRLIQEIGSYAGLAAIPGLAVLSALYFSQARDVRRLREWAGRAPERAAEQAVGGRQAQPAARPAAAAARVAQPAVVRQGGNGAEAQSTAEGERTAAKPAALTPAAVASAAAGAAQPGRAGASTGTMARPGAAAGALPRKQIPSIPGSGATAIRPAWHEPQPWYRRLADRLPAGRYVALIVVGALVLGAAAAYGITQLSSGGHSTSASKSALQPVKGNGGGKKAKAGSAPAIDPSKVTVTVVNGTTIPNLARDTASKLSSAGFQIGNKVTGTGSLAVAESVVEYRPGYENAAKYVASKLHISQKQPADPDAIAQAGPAQVIVLAGANLGPGG